MACKFCAASSTGSYLFSTESCGHEAGGGISSHNGLQLQSLKIKWHQLQYVTTEASLNSLASRAEKKCSSFIKVKALQKYKNTSEHIPCLNTLVMLFHINEKKIQSIHHSMW